MNVAAELRTRLLREPIVGIVGLDRVGLPLAVELARSGALVFGIDLDVHRTVRINAGVSFVADVSSEVLAHVVGTGRLRASDDVKMLRDADAVILCVPTRPGDDNEPDTAYVASVVQLIAPIIQPGQLVVLESAVPTPIVEDIVLPRFEDEGLEAGRDFFLAFTAGPQRCDEPRYSLRDIPKGVGGLTPACEELAALLYSRVSKVIVPVPGLETARSRRKTVQNIERVDKPRGYELLWAKTDAYAGKVLHIKQGHKLSLQYHERKEETILLYSGRMLFIFEDDDGELREVPLAAGEAHHVPPGRRHRMVALEDCEVFEVSTPFLDDVRRVADDYGRDSAR